MLPIRKKPPMKTLKFIIEIIIIAILTSLPGYPWEESEVW